MKQLTVTELENNYKRLCDKIQSVCDEERSKKIINMYESLGENFLISPASSRTWWHLAYPGGLIQHTLHVIDNAEKIAALWKSGGGTINFTHEELVVAAAHHDLGKAGTLTEEYYLPNNSDWHIKNRGEIYMYNPKLHPWMTVTDRALWLLQHFGITLSSNETLAIKLSDGLYDESNTKYILNNSFREENSLTNNICYIIHMADLMSCRQEHDTWKREQIIQDKKDSERVKKIKAAPQTVNTKNSKKYTNIFDELFENNKPEK